ncbi:hypothetical protein FSP39_004782 [Pinctada imbricata]|uniref:VWFD domain-containing protein n=1 Tax=Pinctada imbricata TaxID=66713 RepID=A0AA88YB42_PINIB|nr:hypothetical protein FSP39_004782 [Pinctada imbricata]
MRFIKNILDHTCICLTVLNASRLLLIKVFCFLLQIYLPTGTTVKVLVNSFHLSIDVNPSESDFKQVEGLCGTFNDDCTDDLTLPNGSVIHRVSKSTCKDLKSNIVDYRNYAFKPKDFSDAWLVKDSDSLFRSKNKVLQRWGKEHYLCKCKMTPDPKNPYQVDCSPNEKATCSPKPGKRVDFPLACTVHQSKRRRKRSWRELPINRPSIHDHDRRRRSTISNSTSWTGSSRESLKSTCLTELSLNKTLTEASAPGKKSIAEQIEEVTCPNECSGQGVCKNGTCVCDPGFGLSDCSIDLSIPPDFHSLMDGGFCDTQEYQCNEAFVSGDDFAEDGNVTCKIRDVKLDTEGKMNISDDEAIIPAKVRTFMSLTCQLPGKRLRRSLGGNYSDTSFINGVAISLSNDGLHFGGEHIFFIFNSLCQVPGTINGKHGFLLKSGFCFIDGNCIRGYVRHPRDTCRECNPATSSSDWSEKTSDGI